MILSQDSPRRPIWGWASLLAGGVHVAAIGILFVRFVPTPDQSMEMPAIAVEMAAPAAPPTQVHDAPTPRQVEAPKQTPDTPPEPKKLPFDPPPEIAVADVKPEVVVPPKKEAPPPPKEKANPLPPAPATTELAAPELKPDKKTAALLADGASAGKASPADLWDARVRSRVELTKRYPGAAERQNQEDNVEILLTIDRSGRLLDAKRRTSRGFTLLDEAALDAARRAAPFPKPPKDVTGDPIRYSLIVRFFKRAR